MPTGKGVLNVLNKSASRELTSSSSFLHGQSMMHVVKYSQVAFKSYRCAGYDLSRGRPELICPSLVSHFSRHAGEHQLIKRDYTLTRASSPWSPRSCYRMRPNRQKRKLGCCGERNHPHVPTLPPAARTQERARAGDGNSAETHKRDRLRSGRRPHWHDRPSPDGAILRRSTTKRAFKGEPATV